MNILFALIATTITWGITALGSATVLFFKKGSRDILRNIVGFSAGVMIAASFWSLLNPAINSIQNTKFGIFYIVFGIICGVVLMVTSDYIINYLEAKRNICFSNRNLAMLVFSITIHNIPEGLAVGVAFGACHYDGNIGSIITAVSVALGIALQNFPEGAAISLPMLNCGYSKKKSFIVGQLSAIVEPIFGVIGAILVVFVSRILPFCLSFAAGCMIFVVADELIPSSKSKNGHSSTIFFIIGFLIMMFLDVTL